MKTLASAFGLSETDPGVCLDVDVLLQFLFDCSRAELLTRLSLEVEAPTGLEFEALIKRRAGREPVAYLTGRKEFYGYEFNVNSSVLIPRPETELLVERALEILTGELAEDWSGDVLVLDIGIGSGAILLSVLRAFSSYCPKPPWSKFEAVGIDLSPEALLVAEGNRTLLGISGPIRFLHGDLLSESVISQVLEKSRDVFLLILANPPYIGRNEKIMPDVGLYEPPSALYGGETGIETPRKLLEQAMSILSSNPGVLLMEIGQGQADELVSLSALNSLKAICWKDLLSIDRVLEVRKTGSVEPGKGVDTDVG